jgi:ribosome-binding factor A
LKWRPESVGRQVQAELSELIQRRLKDPRLGYVTLTGVRMTRDLRTARVFVSVMGEPEDRKESLEALHHAAPFLRRELGKRLRLRNTPELRFDLDDTIESGTKINALLDGLKS